ncbi:MAG: preprotein translocase subunit SecY [Candidatus Ornithospirochaeta sp.]|nr:preprotein translocase subunit SecY [Candidatus Ornithospirochaeta sp.]
MANTLVEMFRMKDIRKKILITFGILALTRVGAMLPIPGINPSVVLNYFESSSNSFTEYLNFFSGGAFANFSIFMLGVMPYISMQIIMQLLMLVIPSLKKLAQDPQGSKKIQQYTRYGTVIVCLIQSLAASMYATSIPDANALGSRAAFTVVSMISVTAGSMLMIWLGEKITQFGVGNGISLLIFAGIVARIPSAFYSLVRSVSNGILNPVSIIVVVIMFFFVVVLVVYEEQGQRKIPVNYARRVVGRKMYGSQSSYIPFKINPSGVIPVIFASTLLSFPLQLGYNSSIGWLRAVANFLNPQGAPYLIIYTLLIIGFAFFYTQISLNPVEMAKNIRDNGGSIPGIRNEKLEEYLSKVLNRIVLPGALFLAFIALIPTLIQKFFSFPSDVAMLFGGTSLIILVGVDLETMRQLDGMMKMHHHDGFVDAKKRKLKKF